VNAILSIREPNSDSSVIHPVHHKADYTQAEAPNVLSAQNLPEGHACFKPGRNANIDAGGSRTKHAHSAGMRTLMLVEGTGKM
jgi:hypothetical protein